MNKREFMTVATLAGLLPTAAALAANTSKPGTGLLTVSGAVGVANRGPFDPVLDQMMAKHGVRFARAFVFDALALQRLPAVTINPTLEYDAKVHALSGPLLSTVLEAVGVGATSDVILGLRAVDGYNVALSRADAHRYRMVIATHIDGQPLALGGLGPQWAIIDADSVPPFKDAPLKGRFALCPWGLYHIDVKPA